MDFKILILVLLSAAVRSEVSSSNDRNKCKCTCETSSPSSSILVDHQQRLSCGSGSGDGDSADLECDCPDDAGDLKKKTDFGDLKKTDPGLWVTAFLVIVFLLSVAAGVYKIIAFYSQFAQLQNEEMDGNSHSSDKTTSSHCSIGGKYVPTKYGSNGSKDGHVELQTSLLFDMEL